MTDGEKREAYERLGIRTWMEFRDKIEAEQELERKKNDPLCIQRYSLFTDGIREKYGGKYILYDEYIDKIERLKAIHAKELAEARRSGYEDGKESNYSWRV